MITESQVKEALALARLAYDDGKWEVGYESYTVEAGPMKICDIRGWGYLTGTGGLNLPPEVAKKIQDGNAAHIAQCSPDFMIEVLESWGKMHDAIEFALHGLDTPMARKALELAIADIRVNK